MCSIYIADSGWAPRQPPAEQRAVQWLTFARYCLGQHNSHCTWDLAAFAAAADGLAALPPYKVPLSSVRVVFHHASIAQGQVLQAINGAVVGLTKVVAGSDKGQEPVSDCLGVGVVRSVDVVEDMLYILTSTPAHLLPETTTLEVKSLYYT